jgi:hypothetical protein
MVTLSKTDALLLIARVKRLMPNNAMVSELCSAFEAELSKSGGKTCLTRAEIQRRYRQRRKEHSANI